MRGRSREIDRDRRERGRERGRDEGVPLFHSSHASAEVTGRGASCLPEPQKEQARVKK